MPKPNKAADLLKVLGQRTPSGPKPSPNPPPPAALRRPLATQARRARAGKPQRVPSAAHGKAIQFYLHDSDEKLIRELAVWLSPHRKRINDSLVIKAVLRAAKTGPGLLAGYDEGIAVTRAHRTPKKRSQV